MHSGAVANNPFRMYVAMYNEKSVRHSNPEMDPASRAAYGGPGVSVAGSKPGACQCFVGFTQKCIVIHELVEFCSF